MLQHDLTTLQDNLPTQTIGHPIHYYARVGSTNDLVREQARAGQAEGLVVITDEQITGRGRMGRKWNAPPASSLLMSLLLRPTWLAPSDVFALTMLAGVALCEAVEEVARVRAALKWPNDLMLPVAHADPPVLCKAAGILSELELADNRIAWVVIGIGVNVNWAPQGTVDGRDLAQVATSISAAAGHEIDRATLLRALLIRLDTHYNALRRGRYEALFTVWRELLATLGQTVRVRLPAATLDGVAEDVSFSGALRLRDQHGVLHEITAGDVGI